MRPIRRALIPFTTIIITVQSMRRPLPTPTITTTHRARDQGVVVLTAAAGTGIIKLKRRPEIWAAGSDRGRGKPAANGLFLSGEFVVKHLLPQHEPALNLTAAFHRKRLVGRDAHGVAAVTSHAALIRIAVHLFEPLH